MGGSCDWAADGAGAPWSASPRDPPSRARTLLSPSLPARRAEPVPRMAWREPSLATNARRSTISGTEAVEDGALALVFEPGSLADRKAVVCRRRWSIPLPSAAQGCIRDTCSKFGHGKIRLLDHQSIKERCRMDIFSVVFLAFAVVFLGGTLVVGLGALFQVRRAQRERSRMRQHLRSIELSGR
jgi:hypothetical protein